MKIFDVSLPISKEMPIYPGDPPVKIQRKATIGKEGEGFALSFEIEATLPTSTPRIFTFASGFITRPARSDTTVTGTVVPKPPRNMPIDRKSTRLNSSHRT